MKIKKSISLISMLCGISALFFYPGIIIIEVFCEIETFPLSNTIIGNTAFICAILGLGLGVISKNELNKAGQPAMMSIIGIVCSIVMILFMGIAGVFMILEEHNILKLFK